MALMDSIHSIAVDLKALDTFLHFHGILWEVFLYSDEQFKISLKIFVLNYGYTSNTYGNTENVKSCGSCRLFTVTQCCGLFGWDNGGKLCSFWQQKVTHVFPCLPG